MPQTLRDAIISVLPSYRFGQFRAYPARDETGWQKLHLQRLEHAFDDAESVVRYNLVNGQPVVLGGRRSDWDTQHFGYGVASINLIHSEDSPETNECCQSLLAEVLSQLRAENVCFVSARINGDMTSTIHIFEDAGFRYYETVVWPVARCTDATEHHPAVRLMREEDMTDVVRIATNYQYKRGHFHADPGFDRGAVDELYAKWIRTSWSNGEPIAVIEDHGRVAGYFNLKMDSNLSEALGYTYSRMRSLALDGAVRGRGLGRALFHGAMALVKNMGAEYIDSGYATKNHLSARLHALGNFYSVYEEVTLHLWP